MITEFPGVDFFVRYDWRYAELFFIAIILTSITVLTHYMAMSLIRKYFRQFWLTKNSHRTRHQVMVGVVCIMMVAHFVEVLIWALFYFLRGILPSLAQAMYFSIASYSTLGESGISLPPHYQGLGGFESMNAVLMFGWSTAMLAAVVMKLHNLDD